MSSGERTSQEASNAVKGVFSGLNEVGEAVRNNVNGLADGVGDGVAGRTHNTSSGTTTHATGTTTHTTSTGTGVGAGPGQAEAHQGVDKLGTKLDEAVGRKA